MEKFLIVTNDWKDKDGTVTNKVKRILEDGGKTYVLCQKDEHKRIIRGKIPEDIDCAIVIGGDGSLIEAARILKDGIPILGINMGMLGYMMEAEVETVENSLRKVLNGQYMIEERMMLSGIFQDKAPGIALNDIVLTRRGELRVIHFNLYVNGALLNSYEADGVIVSTPTGSTAYNLSAGGPIVEPTASIIVITPICPHALLNTSSIVLPADDEIEIEIDRGGLGRTEEVYISFDAADTVELKTGDRIKICKSEHTASLMILGEDSFLERLRRKMKGS